MNSRSFCEIPNRQWPPAESAESLSKNHAAVRPSSPRPAARKSRAGRRPRAAACRRARCPRPPAPARPPRSLWPQLPSASRWPPGHRRRERGALRLSARPQPALRWRGRGVLRLSARPQPALRWRHVGVGRHRPRRLLAPLSAADRCRVRLSHLCAPRPRETACLVSLFWIRARALHLARICRDTQWTTM